MATSWLALLSCWPRDDTRHSAARHSLHVVSCQSELSAAAAAADDDDDDDDAGVMMTYE